jgi:hypothetical protein
MRSDSVPLSIHCSSAAAKVSTSYACTWHEKESRGRQGASRVAVLHTEHVIQGKTTRQLSSELLCRRRGYYWRPCVKQGWRAWLMEEGRRPNYVSLALGEVQDWQHEMQGRCSSDGEEKEGSGGDRERERERGGGGDRGHGVSRA